jgi:hypothetical protein
LDALFVGLAGAFESSVFLAFGFCFGGGDFALGGRCVAFKRSAELDKEEESWVLGWLLSCIITKRDLFNIFLGVTMLFAYSLCDARM